MNRTAKPQKDVAPVAAAPVITPHDDDADIRYSLTALGEIAVARAGRGGRGPKFQGFGPCTAVA